MPAEMSVVSLQFICSVQIFYSLFAQNINHGEPWPAIINIDSHRMNPMPNSIVLLSAAVDRSV